MIIDCDTCAVRGDACGDCVVTVLLGAPPGPVELDSAERRALDALAAAGMVPRLQLIENTDPRRGLPRSGSGGALDARNARIGMTPAQPALDERSPEGVERSTKQAG